MTWLLAPEAYAPFFTAPEDQISFGPAVQQFTDRVFGLPPQHFVGKHGLMLRTLRWQLVPGTLPNILHPLHSFLRRELEVNPLRGRVDLCKYIQDITFRSSVSTFFGSSFLEEVDVASLLQSFQTFESGFEMAASPVPLCLQWPFLRARSRLVETFRQALLRDSIGKGTVVKRLIDDVQLPDSCTPNMMLCFMWASQANATPTAFWTLAFLLLPENAAYRERVEAELHATRSSTDPAASLVDLACSRSSALNKCIAETIRLRAPSIDVRIAASDVMLRLPGREGLLLEKGSVLATSPFESHSDERLYGPDARHYNPDREGMLLCGKTALHSSILGVGGVAGLAFGGGKYRCPGRYFAEAEVALVVGMILLSCPTLARDNLQQQWEGGMGDPHGCLPAPDFRKLLGIKVPAAPCWVSAKEKGCWYGPAVP
ncbi:hypothetical protein APUTEX25_003877 [Auxenochlorella protothecoides]|nr:hypothetical protein APUTEX25_003877 [Auxenochlorella protothecoides]|eukprot:RMZ53738.1 hypothetical protein APUTEX25_003877 [Auxenochlorella protothecoides]